MSVAQSPVRCNQSAIVTLSTPRSLILKFFDISLLNLPKTSMSSPVIMVINVHSHDQPLLVVAVRVHAMLKGTTLELQRKVGYYRASSFKLVVLAEARRVLRVDVVPCRSCRCLGSHSLHNYLKYSNNVKVFSHSIRSSWLWLEHKAKACGNLLKENRKGIGE